MEYLKSQSLWRLAGYASACFIAVYVGWQLLRVVMAFGLALTEKIV